jgi:hypothetical protein
MKKISIICFSAILVMACNKNSLPTISRREAEPPPPVPIIKKDFIVDMDKGKTIFTNRCSRCHGLHDPKEFNAEKWDIILSRMIPRARLSSEEAANVKAFIRANSAK